MHEICDRHYVDDCVGSFQTDERAIKVVKEVIYIHKSGGFNLRQLNSNSVGILRHVKTDTTSDENAVKIEKGCDRILGMHWITKTDSFVFKLNFQKIPKEILDFQRKFTKKRC